MKSLNIDIIVPWEIGLIIVISGILLTVFGVRQSKKGAVDNFDDFPITKPTTKIFFGSIAIIFGLIQLLPLLK